MAFVVRKPGSSITEAQVMEFIAKQACSLFTIYLSKTSLTFLKMSHPSSDRREMCGHYINMGSSQLYVLKP